MSYTFRPAIKEQVNLLIGLIGASGSGKTYTAMRLASGMVGKGNKFAVIDTEARRSLHYAEMFDFDMAELNPPFKPANYADAILSAEKAGYKVIVIDSMSHEWSGESGILDWQEEELTRMAGDDWKKREACKMASWIKPKSGHKQMVQKLLQVKTNLILCFRAEEKVGMEKDANGKTVIVPKGWQPICEKSLPYELTVSFLLTPDKPGYPQPIKLQEQHKTLFPLNQPINEESGQKVEEWASGGKLKPVESQTDEDLVKARKSTHAKATKVGVSHDHLSYYAKLKYLVKSTTELTIDQWREIYDILNKDVEAFKSLIELAGKTKQTCPNTFEPIDEAKCKECEMKEGCPALEEEG